MLFHRILPRIFHCRQGLAVNLAVIFDDEFQRNSSRPFCGVRIMAKNAGGRKRGSKNRGYFFRTGRGWYASDMAPLRDEQGIHIKDPKMPHRDLKDALDQYRLDKQAKQKVQAEQGRDVTIRQVCHAYLAHAKATGSPKTHHDRADTLFDFCFGIPPQFREKKEGANPKKMTARLRSEMESKRIHKGYGGKRAGDLIPLDIDQWLDKHPNWKGRPSLPHSGRQAIPELRR